jgi:hypothetical protein
MSESLEGICDKQVKKVERKLVIHLRINLHKMVTSFCIN